jgi:hypothetical protein
MGVKPDLRDCLLQSKKEKCILVVQKNNKIGKGTTG